LTVILRPPACGGALGGVVVVVVSVVLEVVTAGAVGVPKLFAEVFTGGVVVGGLLTATCLLGAIFTVLAGVLVATVV
jgi:hypothetical protein